MQRGLQTEQNTIFRCVCGKKFMLRPPPVFNNNTGKISATLGQTAKLFTLNGVGIVNIAERIVHRAKKAEFGYRPTCFLNAPGDSRFEDLS